MFDHNQAAESLCMNGRALNEKAIEVSPSSSRVLDRAAEILTPFPPSKNRPRPGDWNCPSCGFSNFQRRTACFRCSFPAAGASVDPYSSGYGGYGQHQYGPPVYGGGPSHHGHHHGGGHHHHGGGRGNGPVPFRAGDWRCGAEGCQYHNFAKNVNCLRCGAPRATAAMVIEQNYPSPMAAPPNYNMGPPSQMGSEPGHGPYGAGAQAFGSGAAFAQPPPSTYGMQPGFPQMGAMTPGYASSNISQHSFGPAAQAAFSGAADTMQSGNPQNGFYNNDQGGDPFAFLNSGLSGLSVNDENQPPRRNGNPQSAKSPA
jgi:hypothetical protein